MESSNTVLIEIDSALPPPPRNPRSYLISCGNARFCSSILLLLAPLLQALHLPPARCPPPITSGSPENFGSRGKACNYPGQTCISLPRRIIQQTTDQPLSGAFWLRTHTLVPGQSGQQTHAKAQCGIGQCLCI